MPIEVPSATVQMIWHERTAASPAHAWLRQVVAEVGAAVRVSCQKVMGRRK